MRLVLEFRTTSPSARRYYSPGRTIHEQPLEGGNNRRWFWRAYCLPAPEARLGGRNPDRSAEVSPFPADALPSCEWIFGARRNRAPLRGVLSRQRKTHVSLGNVVDVDPNSEHVLLENRAIPCAEADANFGGSSRAEHLPCAGGLLTDTGGRSCISACVIAGSSASAPSGRLRRRGH